MTKVNNVTVPSSCYIHSTHISLVRNVAQYSRYKGHVAERDPSSPRRPAEVLVAVLVNLWYDR